MKEQLIEFETAKLAKEKGFDLSIGTEYVWAIFNKNREPRLTHNGLEVFNAKETFNTPTQSLLQKWLREEYNLFVYALPTLVGNMFYTRCLNLKNTNYDLFVGVVFDIHFKTYEEALEKGLIEALKLIK